MEWAVMQNWADLLPASLSVSRGGQMSDLGLRWVFFQRGTSAVERCEERIWLRPGGGVVARQVTSACASAGQALVPETAIAVQHFVQLSTHFLQTSWFGGSRSRIGELHTQEISPQLFCRWQGVRRQHQITDAALRQQGLLEVLVIA